MPMANTEQATKKFMEDLQAGKFKKDKLPNPPPYFEATKEQIEKELKIFDDFLDSDLFNHLKSL